MVYIWSNMCHYVITIYRFIDYILTVLSFVIV